VDREIFKRAFQPGKSDRTKIQKAKERGQSVFPQVSNNWIMLWQVSALRPPYLQMQRPISILRSLFREIWISYELEAQIPLALQQSHAHNKRLQTEAAVPGGADAI
jgi:hypothetical protein